MHPNHIGLARIVKRRTPTWPSRVAPYYDFTPLGGGFFCALNRDTGAIVMSDGICANMQTGEVYSDARFNAKED